MTNNKYTPQGLSKKLAELGVEVESEKYVAQKENEILLLYKDSVNVFHYDNGMEVSLVDMDVWYPAYTLSDMPEVLKAVGEKKSGHKLNNLGEYTAKVRFEYICSLYYVSPDKAWQYLEDLLDNK